VHVSEDILEGQKKHVWHTEAANKTCSKRSSFDIHSNTCSFKVMSSAQFISLYLTVFSNWCSFHRKGVWVFPCLPGGFFGGVVLGFFSGELG